MKKMYFHIGTPKTGTTAIQAFCYRNRDILEKDGVYYPISEFSENFSTGKYPQAGNGCAAAKKTTVEAIGNDIIDLMGNAEKTVISSEEFAHYNCFKLGEIAKYIQERNSEIDIIFIIYLRNQADYYESFYREIIQDTGLSCSPQEAYEYLINYNEQYEEMNEDSYSALNDVIRSCDYYGWINNILQYISKDKLIIKNYDELMKKRIDLVDDFFESIGVELNNSYVREKREANPSIGVELLEAKRIVNSWENIYGADKIRDNFMYELRSLVEVDKRHGKCSLFTNEQRRAIWGAYRDKNKKIAELFFKEDDLFEYPMERENENLDIKRYIDEAIRMLSGAILQVEKITHDLYNEYWAIERKRRHSSFLDQMIFQNNNIEFNKKEMLSKPVIGWGAGNCFKNNIDFVREMFPLDIVCDQNKEKWGQIINGAKVISPEELAKMGDAIVVIFLYDSELVNEVKSVIDSIGSFVCVPVLDWTSYVNAL